MERNIADIMTLGWTEEEIRTFDSAEQKRLARTARRLQKQAQWQLDSVASGDGLTVEVWAMAATVGK